MSNETDTLFDENSNDRPLGLASTDKKQKNSYVDKLIKNNSRNTKSKDNTQHMKSMKYKLLALAGANSLVKHHNMSKYKKFTKSVEHLTNNLSDQKNMPGASGVHGRSASEIFAEERLKKEKNKFDKFMRKHSNLQRPQSLSEKVRMASHTLLSGVKEAIRTQNMKGISEAQGGSDARALAAAAAAGYVPGEDAASYSSDYSL